MEKRFETIVNDITTAAGQLLQKMDEKTDSANIVRRTSLQAGVHDYIRFFYYKGQVHCFMDGMGNDRPDVKYEGTDFPDAPLTKADIDQMLPLLQEKLKELYRSYDDKPVLDFEFQVEGKFRIDEKFYKLPVLHTTSEAKKNKLLQAIDQYLSKKIKEGQYPTKELETFFLSKHLINTALYPETDVPAVIAIFEKIRTLNKHKKETLQQHQHHITYALRRWAEDKFLPTFFNVHTPSWGLPEFILKAGDERPAPPEHLLDLLIYAGVTIIRFEPNYSRSTGVGFIEKAKELGSTKATQILKTGSGTFNKTDCQYKDADVNCIANDVFATFDISFKNETAAAYGKALDFICNLLEKDFPPSYEIKCKSKTKNLLPVKGLGKSGTQRFFANALQYPALFPQLEKYVQLAIRLEYEWYNDAEAEQCARPGTYAVFGLALADARYFPLLHQYLDKVDDEHQSVQNNFLATFIQQHGINAGTIPIIVDVLRCAQDIKPMKELKALETAEHMEQLKTYVRSLKLESYELDHLAWFIWKGKKKLEL
ncbi:hypothetical protein SAMN04488128_101973 [Chitinophaga eiseniae]|uniref:Uncharacterized protein n=1 Tax=Chitinophaga eiseniae TaxID=634771 RepID=A0A1T4M832_9BACT|nr:DUF6138 family protein [Chitinophaga eiseniae]SJZ62854.1 hypothetical protein SAMN04488128_101973 [Chitinophaga eiseniae]